MAYRYTRHPALQSKLNANDHQQNGSHRRDDSRGSYEDDTRGRRADGGRMVVRMDPSDGRYIAEVQYDDDDKRQRRNSSEERKNKESSRHATRNPDKNNNNRSRSKDNNHGRRSKSLPRLNKVPPIQKDRKNRNELSVFNYYGKGITRSSSADDRSTVGGESLDSFSSDYGYPHRTARRAASRQRTDHAKIEEYEKAMKGDSDGDDDSPRTLSSRSRRGRREKRQGKPYQLIYSEKDKSYVIEDNEQRGSNGVDKGSAPIVPTSMDSLMNKASILRMNKALERNKAESKKDEYASNDSSPRKEKLASTRREKRIGPRRDAVLVVTMNLNGESDMGWTPAHKYKEVERFLKLRQPDIIFFQDVIDEDNLIPVLDDVSGNVYDYKFEPEQEVKLDGSQVYVLKKMTGLAWNKKKYHSTRVDLNDGLSELRRKNVAVTPIETFERAYNFTLIRLKSKEVDSEGDGSCPAMLAASWHAPTYQWPLKDRVRINSEFLEAVGELADKGKDVPVLIGGDFNIDMKAFPIKHLPGLVTLNYRPESGKHQSDLRTTFVYSYDALRQYDTQQKWFHPDVFPSAWVSIKVQERDGFDEKAVVTIQRGVRGWLKNKGDSAGSERGGSSRKSRNSGTRDGRRRSGERHSSYDDREERSSRRRSYYQEDETDRLLNTPSRYTSTNYRRKKVDIKPYYEQPKGIRTFN